MLFYGHEEHSSLRLNGAAILDAALFKVDGMSPGVVLPNKRKPARLVSLMLTLFTGRG